MSESELTNAIFDYFDLKRKERELMGDYEKWKPVYEQYLEAWARLRGIYEREAQRRSFAFGNASIDNPNVTREMIDAAASGQP